MRRLLFATTALVPLGLAAAAANPLGGNVAAGGATISGTGTANVTINQSTQSAVINWNSFNIGSGEKTQFVQPNAASTVLNRVTGDINPSQINGTLNANGRVFLINPNGILIGNGASINVSGFLASTHDITNADFMDGHYNFNIPGRPDASIVNNGIITASNTGFAALVAPGVRNSGTITAAFGKIGLASANGFALDLYGDKLIQIGVSDQIAGSVKDVATGQTLQSLVHNTGTLKANGGRVELTAAAARTLVDSVINTSGVIEARTIGQHNGKIVLGGPTADTKAAGLPTQTVKVSGKLDASSKKRSGGTVEIVGENIVVADARIDASGKTGGGKVLIGGDLGGGKGNPLVTASLEAYAIPNATTVSVNAGTTIDASARETGDGGKVILWANDHLTFAGQIAARGGELWGNGGFVETSAHSVDIGGTITAGKGGTWLLDPADVTVDSTLAATANGALNSGSNFIIQTGISPGGGNGDIFVNTALAWNTGATLTLSAYRDIWLPDLGPTANIRNFDGAAGNLVMRADSTGIGIGRVIMPNSTFSTRVDWTGSTGNVSIYYNPITGYTNASNYLTGTRTGDIGPTFPGGVVTVANASQLTSYMLVNSAANLQSISTNLAGTYALGKDIDASSILNFVPLGNISPTQFTGILDGFGGIGTNRTISNLTIAPVSGTTNVGLFGVIGAAGKVRNLNITNASVTADPTTPPPGQFIGILAGANAGTISNVTVSGTVSNGIIQSGVIAGGLVGQNGIHGPGAAYGTIINSSAAVNVTVGNGTTLNSINSAGGLVGSNPGTIEMSSASGNVTAGTLGIAGGLVGQNGDVSVGPGPFGPGILKTSFATGNVIGGMSAGGLVGQNSVNGTIQDSFATGNVSATDTPAANCNDSDCRNANAGGLVGGNSGLIFSSNDFSNPNSFLFFTFATGNVHVASAGVAGGLVGFNNGRITAAYALGAVTGDTGLVNSNFGPFGQATVLGGLAGTNQGLVETSIAIGNVGSPNVDRLLAGGLVGDASGTTKTSVAFGNVSAGNFSQAGGFAGTADASDCNGCGGGGIAFNSAGLITGSGAFGNVTVGHTSLAGGFVGSGSTISDSFATGMVTGGHDSILGGFAGIHQEGIIERSFAYGAVTGTGANSWIGGFVGLNAGQIIDSSAFGDVSGTSNSLIGGFAAINVGLIDPSFAGGLVFASGIGNFLGGFGAVNLGTIDFATATNLPTAAGANNIIGGILGANAQFANIPAGLLSFSSFPIGTLTNSTGPSPAIGTTFPTSLPAYPAIFTNCNLGACQTFLSGILGGSTDLTSPPSVPPAVQAPPIVFNPLPLRDNASSLPTIAALIALPGGPGGGGGAGGPSGPVTYANATPGVAGFTPPPLQMREGPDGPVPNGMPPLGERRFVLNLVVMRLSTPAMPDPLRLFLTRLGIRVISIEPLPAMGGSIARLELPPTMSVRDGLARLQASQLVPGVSPEYKFMLSQAEATTKGDPAQYTIGKFDLEKTHRVATGKGVTIAVIDSEVDKRHTELQGKISDELDTLTVKEPPHSHGTAMAGAIASRDKLLGVAPGARIIAVRAFSESASTAEGTSSSIIKGIEWAISQNAKVINMSFAGPRDPALERALKSAYDRGIIMVAAAGNAGPKSPPLYPGADPHVIAVTATDVRDRGFRGANQGAQLSVAAPGVEILSPAPEANYQMQTGTSIATAHVTGVVALMLERNPRLKPADVRRILEETASDLGPKGKDAQFGWGLVNPQKALQAVEAGNKSSDASPKR